MLRALVCPSISLSRTQCYTSIKMVTKFNFRAVFITGCNRGIGLAFVRHLLRLPQPPKYLFATCRSLTAENSSELRTLAEANSNLHVLEFDVNDEEGVSRVVSEVDEKLQGKGLNLLINNAGVNDRATLEDVTADRMRDNYNTNVVGPLMLTKAFLPLLRRAVCKGNDEGSHKPVILNIASKYGSIENNSSGARYPYRASKTALNMVTKSLSIDLADDEIMAVVLHPGSVKTDMAGPNALITAEESVRSMIIFIGSLDDTKNGRLFDYNGKIMPW